MQFSQAPREQAGNRIVFSILAVVSFMLLVALGSRAQEIARPVPPQERRALDPLTGDEQAQAERIARSDGRVKELLGEAGVRVVSVLPVLIKTEAPEKLDVAQRDIEVVLFRPQGEVGARVVVNDLDDEPAGETVEEIRATGGAGVSCGGSVF